MHRRRRSATGAALALLGALALFLLQRLPTAGTPAPPAAAGRPAAGEVARVVDGDTLELAEGQKIRLLGIDAPELRPAPGASPQPQARAAAEFLGQAVRGRRVALAWGEETADDYGRLLAYVESEGRCLNRELVAAGLAWARTRYPHPRQDDFLAAQEEARRARRGLWDNRAAPGAAEGALPWSQAAQHLGEWRAVAGRVVATHDSGRAVFLNFHPDWRKNFYALIFAADRDRFPPDPAAYYRGRTVVLTGLIEGRGAGCQMVLNSAAQAALAPEPDGE